MLSELGVTYASHAIWDPSQVWKTPSTDITLDGRDPSGLHSLSSSFEL